MKFFNKMNSDWSGCRKCCCLRESLGAQFTGGLEKEDFRRRSKLGEVDALGGASEKSRHGLSLVAVNRCPA